MGKKPLSERQENILHYTWQYIQKNGRPPTIREIGEAVDISSTSVVNYNLNKLKKLGYMARESEVSRGLRLTDRALAFMGHLSETINDAFIRIPLVGNIVAGEPIEVFTDSFAVYDDEDAIELGIGLMPNATGDMFALRVSGDSMIDALVNDGDIVIMRRESGYKNGDMVAAWITPDETTTLKYIFNENDHIRLQPANPNYEPIIVGKEQVEVQGKVMMVLRHT
jgi:repressor LexA